MVLRGKFIGTVWLAVASRRTCTNLLFGSLQWWGRAPVIPTTEAQIEALANNRLVTGKNSTVDFLDMSRVNWIYGVFGLQAGVTPDIAEDVVIKSLGKSISPEIQIKYISMLGSEEKITWEQNDGGVKVSVPSKKPCKYAFVYKVVLENEVR